MATHLQAEQDTSVTSLIGGIVNDAQELMKQQFKLLKVEVQDDLRKTRDATIALATGLTIALVGSIVVCHALALFLAWAFPNVSLWVWYAVVGGAVSAIGVGLVLQAQAKLQSVNPLAEQTAAGLEENLEWKTKPR